MTAPIILILRLFLLALGCVFCGLSVYTGVGLEIGVMLAFAVVVPGLTAVQMVESRIQRAHMDMLDRRLRLLVSEVQTLSEAQSGDTGNAAVIAEIKVLKTLLGQLFAKQSGKSVPAKAAPVPTRPSEDEVDDALLQMADDDSDKGTDAEGDDFETASDVVSDAVSDAASAAGSGLGTETGTPSGSAARPAGAVRQKPGSRPIRVIKKTRELLSVVEEGLSENRVDLYLQPVVKLPQRKAVHYECFSRVRDEEGRIILPRQYLKLAAEKGMLGTIDNLLLFRLIQLVRRMGPRNADMRFFCNLSYDSIADEEFFPQFVDYMRSSREFADRIIFEIGQEDYDALDGVSRRQLEDLGRVGFVFSLDGVTKFDEDQDLAGFGKRFFRYMKVDARVLSADFTVRSLDALRKTLARADITLIASRVETEDDVLRALDSGIDMAQGYQMGLPQSLEQLAGDF